MRLPQDRILHIDTEIANGKVNVVAEWQGELVRCKDCRYQIKEKGIMWCSHEDGVCGDAPDNFYCAYGEKEDE